MAIPEYMKQTFGDIRVNMDQWERKIKLDSVTGCINWTGGTHPQNYGMVMIWDALTGLKKMATTHRVAYKMHIDSNITRKDFIIHKCCNPLCVNPDHLILGSSAADSVMAKKMANKWVPRESKYAHYQSQLTRRYIYTVEQLIYARNHTSVETMTKFGVTRKQVFKMRSYGHPEHGYEWLKLILHKYDSDGRLLPGYKPELAVEFQ